jgi:hypothetical protein
MIETPPADLALTATIGSATEALTTSSEGTQVYGQEQTVNSGPAPAEDHTSAKRGRRANPLYDSIWTRHHAMCTMGAICDVMLGGYEAARSEAAASTPAIWFRDVPAALLAMCPWLLDPVYLNFEGSVGLMEDGLNQCFEDWAANRIYYFFRRSQRSEHPAHRTRDNLCAVYREFFDTFCEALSARRLIEEEKARAFWISVSDRVPFQSPPKRIIEATGEEVSK